MFSDLFGEDPRYIDSAPAQRCPRRHGDYHRLKSTSLPKTVSSRRELVRSAASVGNPGSSVVENVVSYIAASTPLYNDACL